MAPFKDLSEELIRSYIKEAESIFLPDGCKFDEDVVSFIKNFDSVDVDACPGSGKTTALLAKLYIMSKYMPFDNNRGICVLTHTNVAIDEVKHRMGTSSSVLFSYPNFFGTIQSFVDRFLAIPAFIEKYGHRNIIIDLGFAEYSLMYRVDQNARFWASKNHKNIYSSLILDNRGKIKIYNDGIHLDLKAGEHTTSYQSFLTAKRNIIEKGILSYNDTFVLADEYLEKHPRIKDAISSRFGYLFIDEMQDTRQDQCNLLNKLFSSDTIIQRIGDQNQAIYNSQATNDDIWKPSEMIINLKTSKRISKQTANVIEHLRIKSKIELNGVDRGNNPLLSPVLMLYTDDTQSKVLDKFCELINKRKSLWENSFNETSNKPQYYAVGWTHENDGITANDLKKTSVKSYLPDYQKPERLRSQKHSSLKNYLAMPNSDNVQPKMISDSLINGFLRVLDLGECYSNDRRYTKRSLFDYLKDQDEFYSEYLSNIALWTRLIAKHACDETDQAYSHRVFEQVSKYLIDCWVTQFDISPLIVEDFINKPIEQNEEEIKTDNVFSAHDVSVNVGTVHSVKGQTHTATLFLECFFHSFNGKQLLDYLTGKCPYYKEKDGKYKKCALKIAYVAMSRPTHFLCAAFHKDSIPSKTHDKLKTMGWTIEKV